MAKNPSFVYHESGFLLDPGMGKTRSCARTERALVSDIKYGSKCELGEMPTIKILGLTKEDLVLIDPGLIPVVP
jgi:hypothetical protein